MAEHNTGQGEALRESIVDAPELREHYNRTRAAGVKTRELLQRIDSERELVHRAAVQPVAPDAREHTPAPFVSGIDVLERGDSGGRDAQAQRADGGRF